MSSNKKSLGVPAKKRSGFARGSSPKKATPSGRSNPSRDDRYLKDEWFVRAAYPENGKHISIHTNMVLAVGVKGDTIDEYMAMAFCGHVHSTASLFVANLIADAANTYRRTRMIPSELAALGMRRAAKPVPAKRNGTPKQPGRKATPKTTP